MVSLTALEICYTDPTAASSFFRWLSAYFTAPPSTGYEVSLYPRSFIAGSEFGGSVRNARYKEKTSGIGIVEKKV